LFSGLFGISKFRCHLFSYTSQVRSSNKQSIILCLFPQGSAGSRTLFTGLTPGAFNPQIRRILPGLLGVAGLNGRLLGWRFGLGPKALFSHGCPLRQAGDKVERGVIPILLARDKAVSHR
jgi:hypothetical protein